MSWRGPQPERQLTALAILPNRELEQQFTRSLQQSRVFQILAEWKDYPPAQKLDLRLRQLQPDVVLLDLSADLSRAAELVHLVASFRPAIQVIGLHTKNDPEAILRSLRAGATEFLHAPFDSEMQRGAAERISRLLHSEGSAKPQRGHVAAFSAAKPGSGASTLAAQTAFALARLTRQRVLLADFDLCQGAIGFFFRLRQRYSLVDALRQSGDMDAEQWAALVTSFENLDILPSPELPHEEAVDPATLNQVIEYARAGYEWIVLDVPAVFERMSLLTLAESDRVFLVSTNELPSLHLTRRAVGLLERLGFAQDRFRVLINRVGRRDEITPSAMQKIFNAPIQASFPNDYMALHQALTAGQALKPNSSLAKTVEQFAGALRDNTVNEGRKPGTVTTTVC